MEWSLIIGGIEWTVEGKQLSIPQRRYILERDNFTCLKCGSKPEISTLREHYFRWFKEDGRPLGIHAYYMIKKCILNEGVTKLVREVIPESGNSWDVTFEFISSYGWEVDHIIPVKDGGTNFPTNLQTLCRACHKKKCSIDKKTREFQRFEKVPIGALI